MPETHRISSARQLAPTDLLLVAIVDYGNTVTHKLPDERVPGGTRVDLQAMISWQIVVAQKATEQANILRGVRRQLKSLA